jgi:predicted  nucleic acid-binding Zn-ribbon protein
MPPKDRSRVKEAKKEEKELSPLAQVAASDTVFCQRNIATWQQQLCTVHEELESAQATVKGLEKQRDVLRRKINEQNGALAAYNKILTEEQGTPEPSMNPSNNGHKKPGEEN